VVAVAHLNVTSTCTANYKYNQAGE